jgi:hypothetical protein
VTDDEKTLITLMQAQSTPAVGQTLANVQLVAHGIVGGKTLCWSFDALTQKFFSDHEGIEARSATQLWESLMVGDGLTFLAVPPGEGRRYSIDRDGDGLLNGAKAIPPLTIDSSESATWLRWPSGRGEWFLESALTLEKSASWLPRAPQAQGPHFVYPLTPEPVRFYRLRRTW